MEISFKGKRALVTGASKGIGKAIAVELMKCGADVVAIGRSQESLAILKNEIPSITTIALDIKSNWEKTKDILSNIGAIDLLVNNAGEGLIKSLVDLDEDDIDRIFDINVKALINLTQLVVQDLLRRKVKGSIVNISSQAGIVALMDHTVYCASKAAVDAFTRACALELGPHGIRVNSVNPTVIMTEMGRMWWSDSARGDPMLAKIPMGRFGEVHEVVNAVLYLLSDKSSMVTGVCLPIDGGFTSS